MRRFNRGRPRKGSVRRGTCVKSISIDKDTNDSIEKHASWGGRNCSGNAVIIRALNSYIKEHYPDMYFELHPKAQRDDNSGNGKDSPPLKPSLKIVQPVRQITNISDDETISDDECEMDDLEEEQQYEEYEQDYTDPLIEEYGEEDEGEKYDNEDEEEEDDDDYFRLNDEDDDEDYNDYYDDESRFLGSWRD